MHLLLMVLISTVTLNEVALDTDLIENIDGQWVAPGYRIAEEIIIDPIDYGTPLLNPANGSRNVIGFQPFFVDTPDGEKWRIVLAYEGEVVVLQEDAEQRRFQIEKSSRYMMNSANGRYVLLGLEEEERTHEDLMSQPFAEPERRVILLDIETGDQVTATGFSGASLIANDGHIISINNDSLRFYDSSFNLLNSTYNCIRQTSHTLTSYASDGSLFVRQYKEHPEDTTSTLRAYDRFGNVLWESYPPNTGRPLVSEHGEYVFVLTVGRMLCLEGNSGQVLWEQPNVYMGEGTLMNSSRVGACYAFIIDGTPAEVRQNPLRERVLHVGRIEQDNTVIMRMVYRSDEIGFFSPSAMSVSGCTLWRALFGESPGIDLSTYLLCFFSADGSLLFTEHVSETDRRYRNISFQGDYAVDSYGNRIIWFDKKEIHIVTLEEEGASE